MGKIRYLGVLDFSAWQLVKANLLSELRSWAPIVAIQSEYHVLEGQVERDMLPYCRAHGVGFIPYFPLAGGFFTGKYKRGEARPPGSRGESSDYVRQYMTAENFDKIEALAAWAGERGRGLNELVQAWLMAQPQVCSVISGRASGANMK